MPSGATRDCAYLEDKPSGRTEGQHKNQSLPVKEAEVFKAWAHTSSYTTLCSPGTWQVLKLKRQLQDIYGQALGSGLPGTATNRPNYLPCMLKPAWSLSRNEQFGNVQPHDKFFHRPSLWVGVNQHNTSPLAKWKTWAFTSSGEVPQFLFTQLRSEIFYDTLFQQILPMPDSPSVQDILEWIPLKSCTNH